MTRCRCVLVFGSEFPTYCNEPVRDRPFCDVCEDRHPDKAALGVLVVALPIGDPHPLEVAAHRAAVALGCEEVPF